MSAQGSAQSAEIADTALRAFMDYQKAVVDEKRAAVLVERAIFTDADLSEAQANEEAAYQRARAAADALTTALLELRYPPGQPTSGGSA